MVAEQGVTLERKNGHEIEDQDWEAFYLCYRTTYLKRSGHPGYLTRDFFNCLLKRMREQLMLVVAKRGNEAVASALFLFDSQRLYGRYWGALADIRCLHFEACFYQGIEFCIENGIAVFDPGTQGEHKLLRGFQPHETCSYHWIADRRFSAAIAGFLEKERTGTRAYGKHAAAFLPFRNEKSRF
jgi:predicted N-acyltransferase